MNCDSPAVEERLTSVNPGLREDNFRKICVNGFGDPLNAYPHSMMWFKDRLYVATTRANL